jgi:hypothetical protein
MEAVQPLPKHAEPHDIVLNNVSSLLKQLGHQIDAHEKKVEQKTNTQYQRNEQMVNNTINNLYVSIVVLIREVTKQDLFMALKKTSEQLFDHFKLVGNVSFLTHAKEQEEKQTVVTAQVLQNTQRVWKTALENTQPPETSVEALLMSQSQEKFKELDCHRRVLLVALQTYQTNQLQNEVAFIKKVYDIKGHTLNALWERAQLLTFQYKEKCSHLVSTTGNTVSAINEKYGVSTLELYQSVKGFITRFSTLWKSYKNNTQTVDDTHSASNDLRVAIDTLLQSGVAQGELGLTDSKGRKNVKGQLDSVNPGRKLDLNVKQEVENCRQASELLKKHWKCVAKYIEETPELTHSTGGAVVKKKVNTSVALQKNADKMLFCAKNRGQVLKNMKSYPSTSAWVAALRKWDSSMSQLEKEAQVLRRGQAESVGSFPAAAAAAASFVEPELVAAHRGWKRLIYALDPLVSQLEARLLRIQDKQSSVYAVLLNKVGFELKQMTDRALNQVQEMESQHLEYERALMEVEQENFRLLDFKYQSESAYMSSELQGYGPVSERCLDLITKLFKLKTWSVHAMRLKQQLDVLQPLVVKISTAVVHSSNDNL